MSKKMIALVLPLLFALVSSVTFGEDAPKTSKTPLRIMAYNLHHCEGTDGKLDVERIGNVIKQWKPDLVALQELDKNTKRTQRTDQTALLAKQLEMSYAFGKAIEFQGGEYGIAILSRFPLSEQKMELLPPQPQQEQRGVLSVIVEIPGGKKIRFVSTHLSVASETERLAQVGKINTLFNDEIPVILGGDFNCEPQSKPMKILFEQWMDSDDPSFRKNRTDYLEDKIDFILFRSKKPFDVYETRTIHEPVASDHHPIFSVLAF